MIYDPVGGPYTEPAFRSIAWRGRYLVIGFAAGDIPKLPLNLPLLKGASIVGVFWGDFVARQLPDFMRDLTEMFALINQGKLRPHISARYRIEQGAQALQDLLDRKVTGKIIITNGDLAPSAQVGDGATAPQAAGPPGTGRRAEQGPPDQAGAARARFVGKEIGVVVVDNARPAEDRPVRPPDRGPAVDRCRRRAREQESPFGATVADAFPEGVHDPGDRVRVLFDGKLISAVLTYGSDRTRFTAPVKSGQRAQPRQSAGARGQGHGPLAAHDGEHLRASSGRNQARHRRRLPGYLIE